MSAFFNEVLPSLEHRIKNLDEITKRYVYHLRHYNDVMHVCVSRFLMFVPTSTCGQISVHAYHPHPSYLHQSKEFDMKLRCELPSLTTLLHPIATGHCFQFPERRLIQYDCGMHN